MSVKKYLLLILVILTSVSFVRAQSEEKSGSISKDGSFTPDIKFFLPIKPASWTISLTSRGGFSGETRLLVALNSNGNVMCSANETTFQNRLAPTADFEIISKMVVNEIPSLTFTPAKTPPKMIAFCSDCSYQTLKIDYREQNSILTDFFQVGNFSKQQANIKEIYEKLNDLDACR